ncbi:MAG: DUF512 domain-containing protein [Ruminococcaceae bacterium]|nr:DUF512 domain-containing protein [Oscillospiraceae bacterium]
MSVVITGIERGSKAEKHGIKAGWTLISINGHEITDVLDYRFFETERKLELVCEADGKEHRISVKKGEYDSLGLEFETYLMDKQHSCKNKCCFCFIDQLPDGMRESLYFKDDDERLSFLFGNYITMTNLSEREVERIIQMHISPVNISVHTTNPELRVEMMKNPNAGKSLEYLKKFADGGIKINCQLVLCPEINDGAELERSITDLMALSPAVQSIAAVPVGLTKHREGLCPLRGFTAEEAGRVIDTCESFGIKAMREHSSTMIWAADEFYLKAGRPLPHAGYYEDFPQLENGVGLVSLLRDEFSQAMEDTDADDITRELSVATGTSASPILAAMLDEAGKKWHNSLWHLYTITNNFFGDSITVAGLVTGGDLINQLKGKPLGKRLLIPSVMLRHEGDLFLDSVSVNDVEEALGVEVVAVPNDGYVLLEELLK